jgi:hypothetical protein
MRTQSVEGHITNAKIVDRGERIYPSVPREPVHIVRFGARIASSLLFLELAAHHKVNDGWDGEWYEAEFLVRLRDAVDALPGVTGAWSDNFNREADMRQYETLDINAIGFISRRRYRAVLLSVLRSFYDEEALGGPVTEATRRAFRLPVF